MTRPARSLCWSTTKTSTACGRHSPTFRPAGARSAVKPAAPSALNMSRSIGPIYGQRASARRWTTDGTRVPGCGAARLRRPRPHGDGHRNRPDRVAFRADTDAVTDLVRGCTGRTGGLAAVLVSRSGGFEYRVPARIYDLRGRRAGRPLRGRRGAPRRGRPGVVVGPQRRARRDDRRDVVDGLI